MSAPRHPRQPRPYLLNRQNGDAHVDSLSHKHSGDPFRAKHSASLSQLSEMFPSWKEDDLLSLLVELSGDVETAVARISEGHAEQWGAVTRRKEKKATASLAKDREFGNAARGGFRGGRGGGRGGSRSLRGYRESHFNGHHAGFIVTTYTDQTASVVENATLATEPLASEEPSAPEEIPATNGVSNHKDQHSLSPSALRPEDHLRLDNHSPVPLLSPAIKPTRTPGNSKLSWAQVARTQEKSKSVSPTPLAPAHALTQQALISATPSSTTEQPGWEEPTTVNSPSWDDDLQPDAQAAIRRQSQSLATADGWVILSPPSSAPQEPVSPLEEISTAKTSEPSVQPTGTEEINPHPEARAPPPPGLPTPSIIPITPVPPPTTQQSLSKPSTPRNIHRNTARFRTDQAVVMPGITFGGTGTAFDKMGMQFGSLNLGADLDALATEPLEHLPQETANISGTESQPATAQPPATSPPNPVAQQQPPVHTQVVSSTPASTLASIPAPAPTFTHQPQASLHAHHQAQPHAHDVTQNNSQGGQHPSYPLHGPQHMETSLPQPTQHTPGQPPQSQQVLTNTTYVATTSYFRQPDQYYPAVPTSQQQQQHIAQQSQQQQQQQENIYATAFAPLSPQSHLGGSGPQAHLGQAHSPLATGQQQSHIGGALQQAQPHLAGFGTGAGNTGDYSGYSEIPRNFYDSYGQSSAYSGRLSHEDAPKGLPSVAQNPVSAQPSQAQPATPSTLGPQNSQVPHGQVQGQQLTQAQQQQYPGIPPMGGMPYYYNPYYMQNQYYGSPSPGYGQPFVNVKYPPMYSAGPNPGSQPTKPIPNTGGSQSPYGSSLHHPGYGGAIGGVYEDTGNAYQPSNPVQTEYAKGQQQLYGGPAMQSYISGQGSAPPQLANGPQRGPGASGVSTSPENYKPYNPGPDKPNGAGGAQGRVSGQPQQGNGGAGNINTGGASAGSGYYPGRFTAAPQPPGQPGYPQQPTDGPYYQYQTQARHQPYWQ